MDAKDLLLRTDCLFVKANGSVVSTQTHMDRHTAKHPEILSWSDQCNTQQVFAEFRSQINETLMLVTHHYWAMNPNTAAVSVEVGWHQSCIRVCVKVWASHPAIHLHPSSQQTCVTCQTPSLWHPLRITCASRRHACRKQGFFFARMTASFHSIIDLTL